MKASEKEEAPNEESWSPSRPSWRRPTDAKSVPKEREEKRKRRRKKKDVT